MFGVHESLLYPNREQNILPALYVYIMLFILCSINQKMFQCLLIFIDCRVLQKLMLFNFEPHELLLMSLVSESVLNLSQGVVAIKHSHKHLERFVRNLILCDV